MSKADSQIPTWDHGNVRILHLTTSDRNVRASSTSSNSVSTQFPATRLSHPFSKFAAVLILLYEREGRIHVLLTTRSKELRSHPGQTALPGGKVDKEDGDVIETAVSSSIPAIYRSLPFSCVRVLTSSISSERRMRKSGSRCTPHTSIRSARSIRSSHSTRWS